MITLIKIGGSLITNKTEQASFRAEIMAQIAQEISAVRQKKPEIPIILGHGSGSFGHFEAKQHNTIAGVYNPEQWAGFSKVATVAAELNRLVLKTLHQHHLPAMSFQPSSSTLAQNGLIEFMALSNIQRALTHGLLPVVYGDVAFDDVIGGTITSTEMVFTYLVKHLPVSRIILLGEVNGVYDKNQSVISHITPHNQANYRDALGGSAGVDVTGGMLTKVTDMLALVESIPSLHIHIVNGTVYGNLISVFEGLNTGTLISA